MINTAHSLCTVRRKYLKYNSVTSKLNLKCFHFLEMKAMWSRISKIKEALFSYPLHEAIKNNNQEEVIRLINGGASINAKNWQWQTPLHLAAATNQPALIRLLVDNGAKVDARDIFGSSALHYAVKYNHQGALRALTQKGANLNLQSPSKKFRDNFQYFATLPTQAVNLIIKLASIYVLFLTISYSAEFFITSTSMSTLAELVNLVGSTLESNLMSLLSFIETSRLAPYIYSTAQATVEFIKPHLVQSLTTAMFLGLKKAKERYSQIIDKIVTYSINLGILSWLIGLPPYAKAIIWAPYVLNKTVLVCDWLGRFFTFPLNAALRGIQLLFSGINTRIANYFLSVSDNFGGTPLHVAARLNHIESTHHLIEHGADITCQNLNNQTALEVAFDAKHYRMVEQLKNAGLPPQDYDKIQPTMNQFYLKEAAGLCLLPKVANVVQKLEENAAENQEQLTTINQQQPELVFFAKIYNANRDVGKKIMSLTEKFGDNEEQSIQRINRFIA